MIPAASAAGSTAIEALTAVAWPPGAFVATIAFTLAETVRLAIATRATKPGDR